MAIWFVFTKKLQRFGWELTTKYIRGKVAPKKENYTGLISIHGPYRTEKSARAADKRAEKKILDNWDKVMK